MALPPDALFVLRGHQAAVSVVNIDELHGIPLLSSGDSQGTVKVWDLLLHRVRCSWIAHQKGVLSTWFLPTGQLLTHGRDQMVRIWEFGGVQPKIAREFVAGGIGFAKAALLQEAGWLALPDVHDGHKVVVWDIATGQPIHSLDCSVHLPAKPGMCTSLRLRQQGDAVSCVIGHESGHVSVWQLGVPTPVMVSLQLHKDPVFCVDWDPSTGVGLAGSAGPSLSRFVLEPEGMKETGKVTLMTPGVNDLQIRQDGKLYATAGWDG
eukprot:Ihof_evm10s169 gene=Ihof_evmTU10s169